MRRIGQMRDRREAKFGFANIVTGSAPVGAHNVTTAEAPASVAFDTSLQTLPTFRPNVLLPHQSVEVEVGLGRVPEAMSLLMGRGAFQYLGNGRFVVPAAALPMLDDHSIKYELAAEG